jgi:pimeloyl-ACP methyl ester carboxylesterase
LSKNNAASVRLLFGLVLLALYSPSGWTEYARNYLDQHPMQVVESNGVEIAYRRIGPMDAETAVLVMGLGASHTVWGDAFVRGIIASGFQVLLIDNRDTGGSIRYAAKDNPVLWWQLLKYQVGLPVSTTYRLKDMAEDVIRVMDEVGLEKAHLIGASMGGMIAQVVAANNPGRTQTLVSIMSSTWGEHLPEPGRESTAAIRDIADNKQAVQQRAEFMRRMGFHSEAIPRQVMAILQAGDRTESVALIKAPTLVIHGRDDRLLTYEHGEHTAEVIAGSKLIIYDGMGHNIPDDVRPKMLREIGAWLNANPIGLPEG